MPAGRIRIKLKSFDHRVADQAALKIVEVALSTGATVSGPTPLPTDRKMVSVATSPHVDKDAQEHYEMLTHKRIIDILEPTSRTIDALSNLDLPASVSIEIKM